jgi:hypothetical protein
VINGIKNPVISFGDQIHKILELKKIFLEEWYHLVKHMDFLENINTMVKTEEFLVQIHLKWMILFTILMQKKKPIY